VTNSICELAIPLPVAVESETPPTPCGKFHGTCQGPAGYRMIYQYQYKHANNIPQDIPATPSASLHSHCPPQLSPMQPPRVVEQRQHLRQHFQPGTPTGQLISSLRESLEECAGKK